MWQRNSLQQIYHLADARNLESIRSYGLLSAAQLFKRAGLNNWISCHRHETLKLPNGVIIRDQRPMPPQALIRCLDQNLTPEDWYELLNHYVFFWIDLERLERQCRACKSPQYLMTIDAQSLLARYASCAAVTPFNTGNARRAPARRGWSSFVPYNEWISSGWETETMALHTKPRSPRHKPVELTILNSVPDIFDYVIDLRRLDPT